MAKSERQAKLDAFAREQGFSSYWKYRNAQAKSMGYSGARERQDARKTGRGLKGADQGAAPGSRPLGRRRRAQKPPPRVAPRNRQVTNVGKAGKIVETTPSGGGWDVLDAELGKVPGSREVGVTAVVNTRSGPRTVQFRAPAGDLRGDALRAAILDQLAKRYGGGSWDDATVASCQLLIPSTDE